MAVTTIPCPVCGDPLFRPAAARFDGGRVVTCSGCGHAYLNPALSDEALGAIYGAYYSTDDVPALMRTIEGWYGETDGPYQRALRIAGESAGGLQGKRVLEMGCGPGRLLQACRDAGAEVRGLDLNADAVRLARAAGLDVVQGAVEDAPVIFSPNRFDFVFAFEIIEHVRRPADFLKVCAGMLAPGGHLFVSTPNFGLFAVLGNAAPALRRWAEHLHYFTPETLKACFARAGLPGAEVEVLGVWTPGELKKRQIMSFRPAAAAWLFLRRFGAFRSLRDVYLKKTAAVTPRSGTPPGTTLFASVVR